MNEQTNGTALLARVSEREYQIIPPEGPRACTVVRNDAGEWWIEVPPNTPWNGSALGPHESLEDGIAATGYTVERPE